MARSSTARMLDVKKGATVHQWMHLFEWIWVGATLLAWIAVIAILGYAAVVVAWREPDRAPSRHRRHKSA